MPAPRLAPDSSDSDYDAGPAPPTASQARLPRRTAQRLGARAAPQSTLIVHGLPPRTSSVSPRKRRTEPDGPGPSSRYRRPVHPSPRPAPSGPASRNLSFTSARPATDPDSDDDLDLLPKRPCGIVSQVHRPDHRLAPSSSPPSHVILSDDNRRNTTRQPSKRLRIPPYSSRNPYPTQSSAPGSSQSQADECLNDPSRPPGPARLKLPSFRSVKHRQQPIPEPASDDAEPASQEAPSSTPTPAEPTPARALRAAVQLKTLGPSRVPCSSSSTTNHTDAAVDDENDSSRPAATVVNTAKEPVLRPKLKKIVLTGKTKAHLDAVGKQQELWEHAQEQLKDRLVSPDALTDPQSSSHRANLPRASLARETLNTQILAMANSANSTGSVTKTVPTRVTGLTCCPFCSKPLPKRMTRVLQDMFQLLLDEYHRSQGHVGGQRTVGVCMRHEDERVTVPHGIEENWPTTFDAGQLRRRVKHGASDVDSSDGRSVHWHRLCAVIAEPLQSTWFSRILERFKVQGPRALSAAAQMDLVADQRAGYYGEKGWETLLTMCLVEFIYSPGRDGARSEAEHSSTREVFDLDPSPSPENRARIHPTIDVDRISPVTPTVFVHSVLMPELIVSLLQEDLRRAGRPAAVADAIHLRDESTSYGLALFPADDRMAIDPKSIQRLLQGKPEAPTVDLSSTSRGRTVSASPASRMSQRQSQPHSRHAWPVSDSPSSSSGAAAPSPSSSSPGSGRATGMKRHNKPFTLDAVLNGLGRS